MDPDQSDELVIALRHAARRLDVHKQHRRPRRHAGPDRRLRRRHRPGGRCRQHLPVPGRPRRDTPPDEQGDREAGPGAGRPRRGAVHHRPERPRGRRCRAGRGPRRRRRPPVATVRAAGRGVRIPVADVHPALRGRASPGGPEPLLARPERLRRAGPEDCRALRGPGRPDAVRQPSREPPQPRPRDPRGDRAGQGLSRPAPRGESRGSLQRSSAPAPAGVGGVSPPSPRTWCAGDSTSTDTPVQGISSISPGRHVLSNQDSSGP